MVNVLMKCPLCFKDMAIETSNTYKRFSCDCIQIGSVLHEGAILFTSLDEQIVYRQFLVVEGYTLWSIHSNFPGSLAPSLGSGIYDKTDYTKIIWRSETPMKWPFTYEAARNKMKMLLTFQ